MTKVKNQNNDDDGKALDDYIDSMENVVNKNLKIY